MSVGPRCILAGILTLEFDTDNEDCNLFNSTHEVL